MWGRKIHDLSPSTFRDILAWVAKRDGKELVFIDQWFPSSKMCSVCGVINKHLELKHRTWTCECGAFHDRDVNAAINILAEGASSAGLGNVRLDRFRVLQQLLFDPENPAVGVCHYQRLKESR